MDKAQLIALIICLLTIVTYPLLGTLTFKIIGVVFICVSGIIYFRFDILYPFVWLSPFMLLYNVSIVILDFINIRESLHVDEILLCAYLGVSTLFICNLLFVKQRKNHILLKKYYSAKSIWILKKIFIVVGLVLSLYIPFFLGSGFSSKADMNMNGSLIGLDVFSELFKIIFLLLIIFLYKQNKKYPKKIAIIAIILSAAISIVIGERDVLFGILLSSFCVYYIFCKPNLKKTLIIAVIGIAMVPVSSLFKQVSNQDVANNISEFNFIEDLLQGEFFSSGHNIETLLNNQGAWSYQYGSAIPKDVLRAIFPSFMINMENSTGWFNRHYNGRRDEGFGAGFSYLGEGYLQGGYLGIVLWVLILTYIIRILYNYSFKSEWGLTIYIYMITVIIYSMRGDLSYILSPLIKHVMVTYVIISIILPKRISHSPSFEY